MSLSVSDLEGLVNESGPRSESRGSACLHGYGQSFCPESSQDILSVVSLLKDCVNLYLYSRAKECGVAIHHVVLHLALAGCVCDATGHMPVP